MNSCDPSNGDRRSTLSVRIQGANFQGGASVSFGTGIQVREVTYVSPEILDAVIRIKWRTPTGARAVTVTNPDGESGTHATCFQVN